MISREILNNIIRFTLNCVIKTMIGALDVNLTNAFVQMIQGEGETLQTLSILFNKMKKQNKQRHEETKILRKEKKTKDSCLSSYLFIRLGEILYLLCKHSQINVYTLNFHHKLLEIYRFKLYGTDLVLLYSYFIFIHPHPPLPLLPYSSSASFNFGNSPRIRNIFCFCGHNIYICILYTYKYVTTFMCICMYVCMRIKHVNKSLF